MPTNLPERPKPALDSARATLFTFLAFVVALAVVGLLAIGFGMVFGPPS